MAYNKSKKYPRYFYLIAIMIPIAVVLILELGLRIFDYGKNLDQWIEVDDKYLQLNPQIGYRYFHNSEFVPYAANDIFLKVKPKNGIRIFVLGGSSAAGFPYEPAGTFAKYFKKRMKLVYPQKSIEVVNLAMTAVNSYTVNDLMEGVIDQEPDLVLIYMGHNEYYGALGAGSSQSGSSSVGLTRFSLWLNNFKITQFVRNIIAAIYGLGESNSPKSGTMMVRMAKDQQILFDSEIYSSGVVQFRENLESIIQKCKDSDTPLIIGTLASNIKDQPPFVSIEDSKHPSADKIYDEGKIKFNGGYFYEADSLLNYAKDLDALRFRAPAEFNSVINELANKYSIPTAQIETAFKVLSEENIIGNNLMSDHLHPNFRGYQTMGRVFFDIAVERSLLPIIENSKLSITAQHEITVSKFKLSKLDSIAAEQKIKILKSDWPFIDRPLSNKEKLALLNLRSFEDSLAYAVGSNKISWAEAHLKLADHYYSNLKLREFIDEMDLLIDQSPLSIQLYEKAYSSLLKLNLFNEALPFIQKKHELSPDAYSGKWTGTILLNQGNASSAVKYLEESLKFNSGDTQVLYNLAGAYALNQEFQKALTAIENYLSIKPGDKRALTFKEQLLQSLKK